MSRRRSSTLGELLSLLFFPIALLLRPIVGPEAGQPRPGEMVLQDAGMEAAAL